MNTIKIYFLILLTILFCFISTPTFAKEVIITDGSVARFDITNDVKVSPYFTQHDFYNMESNEHLLLLENLKKKKSQRFTHFLSRVFKVFYI